MKPTHPDIAEKRFEYVQLDSAFSYFARVECSREDVDKLLMELQSTIARDHSKAVPYTIPDHPRLIWHLENEDLRFSYQVLEEVVEIGAILSKRTGCCYEPTDDLCADWAP